MSWWSRIANVFRDNRLTSEIDEEFASHIEEAISQLAALFSRRLQQLNVPLSSLDSSHGMTSAVVQLRNPASGRIVQTAWVRELRATRNVLYAGSYSICRVPGFPKPCVKVVFPLPNGNAMVLMKPEAHPDGSFSVTSAGQRFGDPGFYFVVHAGNGAAWARYVRGMRETIHFTYILPSATLSAPIIRFGSGAANSYGCITVCA